MLEKLASSLGRKDELPNIELAQFLFQNRDVDGIVQIVEGFKGNSKTIAGDCIKVLYEIGERDPDLISNYAKVFIEGLMSKYNRLVWGSMAALSKIVGIAHEEIYDGIETILAAYGKGSVITIDNSISVLAGLCKAGYEERILPLLIGHLENCRPKEVPQHAERMSVCFDANNAKQFIETLEKRMPGLGASQQARVKKLLKNLQRLPS
ncbi:MAG: hypothetical protein FWG10_08530 [Eubacteriaceae bacterium]|nr:hypothetical protein [Eubacteriaceae bacterium]